MKQKINLGKGILLFLFAIPFMYACSGNAGSGNEVEKTIPTVQTTTVGNILYTAAKVTARISTDGGCPITEKGICWSTNLNPVATDNKIVVSGDALIFTCEIKDLQVNTSYHVRAFATNEKGTSYGADMSFTTVAADSLPVSVDPLLTTTWSVFRWPFNYYYPSYTGQNSINGKFPAPCGPTTLARVLAYWKGQIYGSGTVDALNTTSEVRFRLNFDTLNINYNNLPNTVKTTSLSEYRDVAKVFLAAGAVCLTNYADVATPGDMYIAGLKRYFNVSDDVHFAKRWEYSKEDWIKLLKNELAHGRPLMIAARKETSPKPWEQGNVEGHWFNIEGYNADNKFYINYNYASPGSFKGYYDVDHFGEYNSYGLVLIGFKPR